MVTRVRISSTFSVLLPLYFDLSTSTRILRLSYFDLLSNPDFLLVETYRSKYSFCRSKDLAEVTSVSRRYENGQSTEKVELMRTLVTQYLFGEYIR